MNNIALLEGSEYAEATKSAVSMKIFTDNRLSFRARGIAAFLVETQPESISIEKLRAMTDVEGRDAIRNAFNELLEAGYITRSYVRKQGRAYTVNTFHAEGE
jgi:predicted RNA binding protein with dsRBD fold (UPF0201 family)